MKTRTKNKEKEIGWRLYIVVQQKPYMFINMKHTPSTQLYRSCCHLFIVELFLAQIKWLLNVLRLFVGISIIISRIIVAINNLRIFHMWHFSYILLLWCFLCLSCLYHHKKKQYCEKSSSFIYVYRHIKEDIVMSRQDFLFWKLWWECRLLCLLW